MAAVVPGIGDVPDVRTGSVARAIVVATASVKWIPDPQTSYGTPGLEILAVENATARDLSADLKLPLAHSIILATARRHGATLWTQDSDFKGIPGVEYRRPRGRKR